MKKLLLTLFLLPMLAVSAVAQESATIEKEPFSDDRFTLTEDGVAIHLWVEKNVVVAEARSVTS